MVNGFDWLSPTRAVGLAAYLASSLVCAIRWVKCGARHRWGHGSGSPFALLTGVQALLLLDMAGDWRWKLHDAWMREAVAKGVYGDRRGPQLFALVVLVAALAAGAALIFHRFRSRRGVALAMMATLLSVGLWFCEAVSYHFVDALFYRPIGNVMSISLLWVCLAIATCFGVWLDGRDGPAALRRL